MVKSVMKEIFIILLLSVAILLILGILFYDYIPINRVIPEREAYVTPDNVLQELSESITETEKVEVTYEVTDSDLNVYKQTGSYTEGKVNPFALEETNTNTNTESNSDNNNNSNNNNNNNGSNSNNNGTNENTNNGETPVDENSTGTFFNDEGIK